MAACHTKANNKKNTGITGSISTKGRNKIYASGNLVKNIIVNIMPLQVYFLIINQSLYKRLQ